MCKSITCVLLFLCLSGNLYSQIEQESRFNSDKDSFPRIENIDNGISVSLSSFISIVPSYQAGYLKRIGENTVIQSRVSIGTSGFIQESYATSLGYYFFFKRSERVRKGVKTRKKPNRYLGIEAFYCYADNINMIFFDLNDVSVYGLYGRMGRIVNFKKHSAINFSFLFGANYVMEEGSSYGVTVPDIRVSIEYVWRY